MKKGTIISIGSTIRGLPRIYCGAGVPVRIIANIGTSLPTDSLEEEMLKAKAAFQAGADIITDHSIAGDINTLHKSLIKDIPCKVSTVSIYQTYCEVKNKELGSLEPIQIIKKFKNQALLGFDLITVHATILKEDIPLIANSNRIIPCSSRGGMMIADLMNEYNIENPFWTHFEYVIEIAKKCNLTISLGTAFRPASIIDTPDILYYNELKRMSKLVKIAIDNDVGIMIEGIGHARIDLIPNIVQEAKKMCYGVPYRVLCVACDSALHRDHISSAISSAISVASGADIISAVSRSEHVGKPDINDVIEAVETAKIAAHCGDIVRINNISIDKNISIKRSQSSCLAIGAPTIIPRKNDKNELCTMCGPYCALKIMNKIRKQYKCG